MDDFYYYAAEAIDIITKQSMKHTLEQNYNEQCLKNQLFVETLVQNAKRTEICIYGSCVVRDISRFLFPKRYNIKKQIGFNPISTLFTDKLECKESFFENVPLKEFYKKMTRLTFNKNVIDELLNSGAEYLILDLLDERLVQHHIEYSLDESAHKKDKKIILSDLWALNNNWLFPQYKPKLLGEKGEIKNFEYKAVKPCSEIKVEDLKPAFEKFIQKILKSDKNPKGFEPSKIILIESLYSDKILKNDGSVGGFEKHWELDSVNKYIKQVNNLFVSLLPGCKLVKLPRNTYCNENHMWNSHPVHYSDETYQYLASCIDIVTENEKFKSTLPKIYEEYSLKNKLFLESLECKNQQKIINEQQKRIEQLENDLKNLFFEYENSLTLWQKAKRYRKKYGLKKAFKRVISKIFKRT